MYNVKFVDIKGPLAKSLVLLLIFLVPLFWLEIRMTQILEIIFDTAIQVGFSLLGFTITALSMLSLLSVKEWYDELEKSKLYPRLLDNFYVAIITFATIAVLGFICKVGLKGTASKIIYTNNQLNYVIGVFVLSVFILLFAFSIFWIIDLMKVLVKLLKATKE